jgi:hypothetical protein
VLNYSVIQLPCLVNGDKFYYFFVKEIVLDLMQQTFLLLVQLISLLGLSAQWDSND